MGAPFWAHLPFEVHSPTYHVTAVLSNVSHGRQHQMAPTVQADIPPQEACGDVVLADDESYVGRVPRPPLSSLRVGPVRDI